MTTAAESGPMAMFPLQSALLPGEDLPRTDARDIYERLEHSVDLVLDGGNCGLVPTSVIDLSGAGAQVVRVGRGDVTAFGGPVPV